MRPANDENERPEAALRALLHEVGPQAVLAAVGVACGETARTCGPELAAAWHGAAEVAEQAAAALARPAAGPSDEEADDDGEEVDSGVMGDEGEPDEGDESDDAPMTGAPDEPAFAEEPARRKTRMPKEDQLGPRPPHATHWRCRRIEDEGRKPTLLFHDDGEGFAICEWPIRVLSPEVIRERWGEGGGSFVVQYVHADEAGLRRPCGRSRMLLLSARAPSKLVKVPDEPSAPVAVLPLTPSAVLPPAPSHGPDSFAQMFSLLAYMQDRDEKVRAASREEARFANDRYKADIELMMERERLAAKERIAQIEATARAAGRAGAGPGIDADALAQRIGAVVQAKVEEVYEEERDEAAAPEPRPPGINLQSLQPLLDLFGPYLVQWAQGIGKAPGTALPSGPPSGTEH